MKQTTLVKLLGAGAACALAMSTANAQVSAGVNVGPVGANVGVGVPGTFTTYTPGQDYFTFRGETGEPSRYYYTPETTVLDPAGHTVAWTDIHSDLPATVYYDTVGERRVVKRVVLKKPVVVEKKETTTTTTTARP
jgi:hypothetical protein